jgi:hypothetical protein
MGGHKFSSSQQIYLKLKYVRTATEGDEYAATVTLDGRNDALPCIAYRTELAQIDDLGFLVCRTKLYNYKFNLKAGRFVESYLMGYISGDDTNDDTPVLSGGVCTKIE